jgi:hypothetical protein
MTKGNDSNREIVLPERPKWRATTDNYAFVVHEVVAGLVLCCMAVAAAHDYQSLVAILLGLLGGCFLFVAWKEARKKTELKRNGKLTVGRVVARWRENDPDSPKFFVAYEYGRGHRAFQRVPLEEFRRLCPGCTVSVRYLSDKPRVSRMD